MPSIVFYLGYANLKPPSYGSELALIKLARQLKKKGHTIYILSFHKEELEEFTWLAPEEYERGTYDVIIVSRYINFYLYFSLRAPKVYLWIHDVGLQSGFNGNMLPRSGRYLLENVVCDGIVTQCGWHSDVFSQFYPESKDKIHIIGNGIDTETFRDTVVTKVKHRFIYTSSPLRGLTYLLSIFPLIKEKWPESQLYIFRGREEFTPGQLQTIEELKDYVFYKGCLDNKSLIQEFLLADVWLYPTSYPETFCISALEAQAAGCLCVCTNLAALGEIVGDRGYLLKQPQGSPEYCREILEGLDYVFEHRAEYSARSRQWGLDQDWSARAEKWHMML